MISSTDRALEQLRGAGLRITAQRRAVIDELVGDESHPTAEELAGRIAGQLPDVSLSTVYKILHEFVGLGLVRQIRVGSTMRFDPAAGEHAHFTCSSCQRVSDIEGDDASRSARRASIASGYLPTSVDIAIVGLCPSCAAAPGGSHGGEGRVV